MLSRIALVVACGLTLAACRNNGPSAEQLSSMKAQFTSLTEDRDAHRITWSEWARKTAGVARATMPMGAGDEEVLAYRTLLAEKVDAKQITVAEFDFEIAKAMHQLQEKQQAAATARLAAINMAGPSSCTTTHFGTVATTNCY